MSVRRAAGKRRSTDSGLGPERGAAAQEKKEQRFALFLRDFDQQAREHIQEMKEELSSLLQTAEKAFAVELLKMPVAIRNMRTKDFLTPEPQLPQPFLTREMRHSIIFVAQWDVPLASTRKLVNSVLPMGAEHAGNCRGRPKTKPKTLEEPEFTADCSLEDIPNPKLVRTNSRKVKVTTIVQYEDAKHTSAKKMSKKVSKTKSLVSLASGFNGKLTPLCRSGHSPAGTTDTMKSPASDCGAANFKTMPKVSKSAGLQHGVCRTEPRGGRAHGMVLRSKSAPQDKTVPFVNIPLADGQTLCTAGGDLRNIDVQLLRQDTIQRIHNLVSELTVLYGKATAKMT